MKQGEAVECDSYRNLLDNPKSYVHKLLDERNNFPMDRIWLAKQKKFERQQRVERYRKRMLLKRRIRMFLKSFVAIVRGASRADLDRLTRLPVASVAVRNEVNGSSKRV